MRVKLLPVARHVDRVLDSEERVLDSEGRLLDPELAGIAGEL